MNTTDYLKLAVSKAGNQTRLAEAIGVRQAHIWNWINRDGYTPPHQVIPICKAVNWEITPHELRPDIYPNKRDGMPLETVTSDV